MMIYTGNIDLNYTHSPMTNMSYNYFITRLCGTTGYRLCNFVNQKYNVA